MTEQAVLLDIGNVILTLDFRAMLTALGMPHSDSEQTAMQDMDRLEIFDAFERGKIGEAAFFEAIRPKLSRPFSFPEFESAWNRVFVGEVAGMGPFLERLSRQVPLYALSNANPIHMRRAFQFPAMGHFRNVFTSYELGARKPEPESYLKTARQIGLPTERILFFDDRMENVEGARAAGLPAEKVFLSTADLRTLLTRHGIVVQ